MDYIKMALGRYGIGIGLAPHRDQWKALVNAVMNIGFYKMLGNSSVASQLASPRAVLSYIMLLLLQRCFIRGQ
jgi:hypothetical protein